MSSPDTTPGFNRPREPHDKWAAQLYEKHDLGEAPSLADIEPIANSLLGDPQTMREGIELVLGREVTVDVKKEPFLPVILFSEGGPQRFKSLLFQVQIEEMDREEGLGEK